MIARAKRTKQSARVGDWVKVPGWIFEVAEVQQLRALFTRPDQFGPYYVSPTGGKALACAVIEIRRGATRPTGAHDHE